MVPFTPILESEASLKPVSCNFYFFIFFFKVFGGHVLFWGHWYPCFGFLVMSPLGFKARVGCLIRIAEANVRSPRSTSGATLANLLAVGMQPVLSPHTVAEVRLPGFVLVLSEYLWARRSTNWAKPGPVAIFIWCEWAIKYFFQIDLALVTKNYGIKS